jgi:hypothetical protein
MTQLDFILNYNNLNKFIDAFKELSKLDNIALFRFNKDNILIYSSIGQNKNINAFRSYIFKTSDILTIKDSEFFITINFIVKDCKNFIKTINNFLDYQQDIKCKMSFDQIGDYYYSDKFTMQIPKELKLNFVGGEPIEMNTSITIEDIKEYINIDNSLFNFNIKKDQFDKIKRLSLLDTKNDVLYINVKNDDKQRVVIMSEIRWSLTICETNYDTDLEISFPKKYFKNISVDGDIKINVFETFILVSDETSSLLISVENNG